MRLARRVLVLLLPALLVACASKAPAPVVDRSPGRAAPAAEARDGGYVVKKGDTLYSIALDHGQDYRDVASWNNLDNPNLIRVGQVLKVTPGGGVDTAPVAVTRPVAQPAQVEVRPVTSGGPVTMSSEAVKREPRGGKQAYSEQTLAQMRGEAAPAAAPAPAEKPAASPPASPAPDAVEWAWPVAGKVLSPFAENGSKGLDLAGRSGEPVHAAAAGTVSYVGSGLRGYGQLVVLRHNTQLLSVYAHNSKILVKEKQVVTRGQAIAEVGSTDADSPRLHFEIRQMGKPVDPLKFLPPR